MMIIIIKIIIINANKRTDVQVSFLVLLIHNDIQYKSLQFMVISETELW